MTDSPDDPDLRRNPPRNPAGSAFGPAADPPSVPPSSTPPFAQSANDFAAWLAHDPEVTPAIFEQTMNTFEGLLVVMRDQGLRPDVPQHVSTLIDLLFADDAEGGSDPDLFDEALESLDDFLHFRIENSRDPEGWEHVHDALEEAMEVRDGADVDVALDDLLSEEDPVPDDVKLRAYAELPILRAVPDLLAWIGKGRAVTATGALRRTDIEYAAGLLGIRAYGTNEPWSPRSGSDPDAPIAARAMSDVPVLDAWWEALQTADVIERDRSRMRPGSAAASASTALTLDTAEEVIGYFLANVITGSGWLAPVAADVAVEAIAVLLAAVDLGRNAPSPDLDEPASLHDEVVEKLAQSSIRNLASMGLVEATAAGGWSIRDELRRVVARATVLAATLVMDGDELDDIEGD
ncbi:hypothetical protein [Microbacterium panaciterrae]|uniref:DUF2785 domain-containing protein n=1 Tax=Microbacterium panaciterrae TaxID=985759 RepID=A0ABP8PEY7_9MICO